MKGKRHTTEEKIRILRKTETGKTMQEVCREYGISEQTFYRWRKNDPEWEELSDHAMNFAEPILLHQLKTAAEDKMGDWRAYAWILERRWPQRWGARQEIELNHNQVNDGGAAMVAAMILQTDERIKQLEKENDDEDV